jgi:hypothetical protein
VSAIPKTQNPCSDDVLVAARLWQNCLKTVSFSLLRQISRGLPGGIESNKRDGDEGQMNEERERVRRTARRDQRRRILDAKDSQ